MLYKFVKFCIVGSGGAAITFGLTWVLTEIAGLYYMLGLVFAVAVATFFNFTMNSLWTFKVVDTESGDYDWRSFYKGNLVQRWWKGRIARTVWRAIPSNSKLLDIGCGSSPIIGRYKNALGIDVNEAKLRYLKEQYPNIVTRQMSAETLDFPDEYFDYVICIELLEHLQDAEKAVAEIARVLKKGGKAVLATPDYARWHWHLIEQFTAYKDDHVTKFTRKKLEAMCRRAGLEPVGHNYVAACDFIGSYRKRYDNSLSQYRQVGVRGLANVALEVSKRIASPRMSRANIVLTYRCNYRCLTCNMWLRAMARPEELGMELQADELEKVFRDNGLFWATYTGGEVTLRPDLEDLFLVGGRNLKVLSTTSNGSHPIVLEKAVRKALAETDVMITVSISLEGNRLAHDKFTRVEWSYDRAVETLQRLALIRCNRLKVGIEWLASSHTMGQYAHIKELAQSLGVGLTIAQEQEAEYYKNLNSKREPPPMPRQQLTLNPLNLMGYAFTRKVRNIGCVAGKYSVFINPQGIVYPCLFKMPEYPLVNLRESNYQIGKLDCKNIIKECEGCWTPCETYAAMIFRPHRLFF